MMPRLVADAQIVPDDAGLLAHVDGRVESISLDTTSVQRALLLDLLHEGHPLADISAATGLTTDALRILIERLTLLGLVATEPASAPTPVDPAGYLRAVKRETAPHGPCCRVLLVGLGRLGLALLREFVPFEHFRLRLFDPTPVGPNDVSPFYCSDELGQAKPELVVRWLGSAYGERVGTVISRHLPDAALESALEAELAMADIAVCCLDQPSDLPRRLIPACHARGVPLVVTQLTAEGAVIEPALVPTASRGARGCANCAILHRANADPWAAALQPYLAARFPRPASWRYGHDLEQIAAIARLSVLAVRKALDIAAGLRPADDKVTRISVEQWCVDSPPVPKHYGCRICYPHAHAAPAPLGSRVRADAASVDLGTLAERLRSLVGASPYGIFEPTLGTTPHERQAVFRAFRRRAVEPLHNRLANAHRAASVRRMVRNGRIHKQVGEYLAFDGPRTAEAIAMIEGLERLFTLDYCPPERIVRGAHADLGSVALDPRDLPLFAPEQYAEPGFSLQRYDPRGSLRWIEGFSLADGCACLVPLDFVCASSEPAIYHATSNGAACHGSLPRAIVNAVYETIERDAFMIAWLNRLALPGVEVASDDADPYGLRDTFRRLGLELAVVDLTTDLAIPVLLGVLRDRHNANFMLVDMVASLDPQAALAKLCRELAQFAFNYLRDPRCFESELTAETDPAKVWTFQDHLAFYQSRDKHRHADFLTQAPRTRSLSSLERPDLPNANAELETLQARLARRGHRIIVINCTPPMVTELGLHVVKVVIPGLQPLNAGHRWRVLGGDRVYQAPVDMGVATRRKTLAELNPWPHPFW